jgi:hypothetical protein
MHLVPARSPNGHDEWTFDSDLGVFRAATSLGLPELCWGDRRIRPEQRAPGAVQWRAFTSQEGRGRAVDSFQAALAWVRQGSFTEVGCGLWSRLLDVDKLGKAITEAHRRAGQLREPSPFRLPSRRMVARPT